MTERVCRTAHRPGPNFYITLAETFEHALHAAQHALRQRAPALVREVVKVALLGCIEQHVVARAQLVDELQLERTNAVPVLARGYELEIHLRSILTDLSLEQLVHVFDFLAQLLAAFFRVLAEQRERALV